MAVGRLLKVSAVEAPHENPGSDGEDGQNGADDPERDGVVAPGHSGHIDAEQPGQEAEGKKDRCHHPKPQCCRIDPVREEALDLILNEIGSLKKELDRANLTNDKLRRRGERR